MGKKKKSFIEALQEFPVTVEPVGKQRPDCKGTGEQPKREFGKLFAMSDCNCTYTATSGKNIKVSIAALVEVMKNIPAKPQIFTMGIKFVVNGYLPKNTIFLSKDVADALEQALQEKK